MYKALSALLLVACVALLPTASAQDITLPREYGKVVKSAEVVGALGADLFGEETSFFTGTTEFKVTDVSLPGNGLVPVRFGRRYEVTDKTGSYGAAQVRPALPFGDWEFDIPRLHGVFGQTGWISSIGDGSQRCTVSTPEEGAPPYLTGGQGGTFAPSEYWHGNSMYVPGAGDQEMLVVTSDNPNRPTDGKSYRWVTQQQWYFSCLPTTAVNNNIAGEAFLATAPDGTRYWFDWIVERAQPQITKAVGMPPIDGGFAAAAAGRASAQNSGATTMAFNGYLLRRKSVSIYPTRIEDRFGNSVVYNWDPAVRSQLSSIVASDGRRIDLAWVDGRVASMTDGTRTWTYGYSQTGSTLLSVTLPDASKWQYNIGSLAGVHAADDQAEPQCWGSPMNPQQSTYTGSITHPSGAVGTFTFKPTLHGRSYVANAACAWVGKGQGQGAVWIALHPILYSSISIISKRIEGPGITTPYTWTYAYGAANGSYSKDCPGTTCPSTKTVETSGPDNQWTRYTFSNKFRQGEGKLVKTETGTGPTNILRTESTTYLLNPANQAFPARIGASPYARGDRSAEQHGPVLQRQVIQQSTTFTWQVNQANGIYAFDAYANPLSVTRFSSLGYSKVDATEYNNNTSKWVLGQVKRQTTDGIETSRADYHAVTALPTATFKFGKPEYTAGYNADGTLRQLIDGRGIGTKFSNWNRGVPQLIEYPGTPDQPQGASITAGANTLGLIDWAEDENGYRTCYSYDPMGRLASISHPSETVDHACDTPELLQPKKWNQTTQAFAWVPTGEYGIVGGHWRQTISTGNARKVIYFDALLRPLVTMTYDNADISKTRSVQVSRYDAGGNAIFQSYALPTLADYTAISVGKSTAYDALGRVTQIKQNWESDATGLLTTKIAYLAGFQTKTTNPRGQSTTTSYYVYDQPTQDFPKVMLLPEGARTTIYRDVFGKPTSLVRSNADSSEWSGRYYVYDVNQQLCKRVELETGSTAMGYDAAGNLAWSAAGLPWSSTTDCAIDTTGRRADRTYDARNRLKTLRFPDGVGDQVWTYTPDGLPEQITTYNAVNDGAPVTNSYNYNRRRLLDGQGESISQPGWYTWGLGYGYDNNGNLSTQVYPNGVTVDYAPNALGQATQVGTYATGVSYFPNGSVARFTYGNGIVHALTQNARQFPDRRKDAYGVSVTLDDSYDYDGNGNVAAISDGLVGARGNRTMTYDGLDRLKSVDSPMFGGTITYGYDTLDNLTALVDPTRNLRYCYSAANRLEFVRSNAANCNDGLATTSLMYDVQGNLDNKNGQDFDFDFGNRLRAVTGKESYRYDGHGRRAMAWAPGYSNGNILSQYDQGGVLRYQHDSRKNKLYAYFYLGSRLVAIRETPIGTSNHVVKYQHTDALGTPVKVTDANRALLEATEYEPYGKVLNRPTHDGPGFTGHIEDAATGLTYMQQRYYDPMCGCFLSVDPVVADPSSGWNFNRFNYAANNPYKYRDPDGRVIDTVFDVGFAAYSAYTLATQPSWTNAGALAADLAGIAIPGVTGLGAGVRAAAHAGDAARSSRSANELGLPGKGAAAGNSVQLSKGLASQQQLGELASGLGTVTHGVAAHKPLRAAENLASQHGGQAADYQKVSSSSYDAADGSHVETHAFRNSTTGQIIEPKTVINP